MLYDICNKIIYTMALCIAVTFCVSAEELSLSNSEILDMAGKASQFMDSYGAVPQMIPWISSEETKPVSITAAEFYYAMTFWLNEKACRHQAPKEVKMLSGIGSPALPDGENQCTVYEKDIIAVTPVLLAFIEKENRLPDHVMLDYGTKVSTQAWFYAMAKAIAEYKISKVLPNSISVETILPPHSWNNEQEMSLESPVVGYSWSKTIAVYYEHQPDGYTCGPTSLKMIMAYYHNWYSVSAISNYMAYIGDSPYYDGVAEGTIISSGRHYGFSNARRSSGWTALKNAIAANNPVVAHLYIKANQYPIIYQGGAAYVKYTGGHYVVVTGLQANSEGKVLYVVCNDPAKYGGIKYSGLSFQTSWGVMDQAIITLK